MIIVLVVIAASEDTRNALGDAVAALETATRAEAGCLDYTFAVELTDPGKMRIVERWESMAALQAHFTAPHMAAFQAAIAEHPPESFEVKFYEASEVTLPGS